MNTAMAATEKDLRPTTRIIRGEDGKAIFECSGHGVTATHRQWWQAKTHWEALVNRSANTPKEPQS